MSHHKTELINSRAATHHLIADLFGVSPQLCHDRELLATTVTQALSKAYQEQGIKPCFREQPNVVSDNKGMSMIVQSPDLHCSIHTYPDQQLILMDILAPRQFDVNQFFSSLCDLLNPSIIRKTSIPRGVTE